MVQEHADIAMPEFEASESRWSQSLIRLDLANSLVTASSDAEPEHAAELVQEALGISPERPITSVLQRSKEFVALASRWGKSNAIIEVRNSIRAAEVR
jgi:hypothetical protein